MEPLFADGLMLRPLTRRDVPAFVEAVRESYTTVARWMNWWRSDYSRADAKLWIAQADKNLQEETGYEMGVFTADGKIFLGSAGLNLFNREHNFCNLGYWVRESRQGQGIATRAARALAEFGFRELKLARIEIVVAQDNLPSQRVAQKIGATFEGVARNRLLIAGRSHAAVVYSLISAQALNV